MSMTHSEDLEYYFKMGEQDYTQGFHEPIGGIASYLSLKTDRDEEINESYGKGWEYARKQDNYGVIEVSTCILFGITQQKSKMFHRNT